jgi:hypothetical protein
MNKNQEDHLTNQEKNLIAMGAAMGEKCGIKPDQMQMCISLAKMVRKNAVAFSDQEISENAGSFEFDMKEVCCPISSNPKSTSSCSCG